jgi:predicted Zn finger-like uncharacterized protein
MIVVCPECQSEFKIPPGVLSVDEGRRVRCSQCEHEWVQFAQEEVLENTEADLIKKKQKSLRAIRQQQAEVVEEPANDGNVVVLEKRNLPYLRGALFVLAICFVVGVYHERFVLKYIPSLANLYQLIGIENTQGVTLYDVEVTRAANTARRHDMVVKAVIKNDSDQLRYVPKARVQLYSKRRELLKKHYAPLRIESLKPGEEVTFRTALWDIPQNTSVVVIDLGNGRELLAR